MRIEAWQGMSGIAGLLVFVAVVTTVSDWNVFDVIVGGFLVGTVLAATYAGWRIGQRMGT